MATVGAPSLLDSGGSAAGGTAITLSAITVLTNPENGVTPIAAANPLTQNHFALKGHALANGGWTTASRSCQVRTSLMR